mgnify:CR=1 FL=1
MITIDITKQIFIVSYLNKIIELPFNYLLKSQHSSDCFIFVSRNFNINLNNKVATIIDTPITNSSNKIDLRNKFLNEVYDQGKIGSCTANAVADAFEAQTAHRKNCNPSEVEDISRLFIYWNARNLNNPPTSSTDTGSRIRFDHIRNKLISLLIEKDENILCGTGNGEWTYQ